MSNYSVGRGGHAKGHVRAAFCEAVEAFYRWSGRGEPPTIEFEGATISIAKAVGLVWNCSDVLPSEYTDLFDERPSTYARAARLLKAYLPTAA